MAITRRRLSVGLACGAAAALVPLAVVYACSPLATVSSSTTSGVPGSTTTVTVSQAYGGYNLTISLSGQTLYSTVLPATAPGADPASSSVSTQVTIPAVPPGIYYLHATVSNPNPPHDSFTANTSFQVTAPASSTGSSPKAPAGTRPGTGSQAPSINGTANSNAIAAPATAGDPQTATAGQLNAADLPVRVAARDGSAPPPGAAPVPNPGRTSVVYAQPESPSNPVMTGLIVGVITLAVGLPVLLLGFATVTALQKRATRTYPRNESKKNPGRLS